MSIDPREPLAISILRMKLIMARADRRLERTLWLGCIAAVIIACLGLGGCNHTSDAKWARIAQSLNTISEPAPAKLYQPRLTREVKR